jgi:polysaccharide biosynthesis transport protein
MNQKNERQPSGSQQPITVWFVLDALRRWWKIALPVGLLLGGVAAAVMFLRFEAVYEASAWIQIDESNPYVVFPDQKASSRFLETQRQLIQSPLVLGPVVSEPAIAHLPEITGAADPLQQLVRDIRVTVRGQSELLNITYQGPNAAKAAAIVNAVTDSYFALQGRNEAERVQKLIGLLDVQMDAKRRVVEQLRKNFREMSKLATGKDPFANSAQTKVVVEQHPAAEWEAKLASTEVERCILEAQAEVLEKEIAAVKEESHGDAKGDGKGDAKSDSKRGTVDDLVAAGLAVSNASVERAVEGNAEIVNLRGLLAMKTATLREYEERYAKGKDDPHYVALAKEIGEQEASLAKLREDLRGKFRAELAATAIAQRRDDLAAMKSKIANYKLSEELWRKKGEEQRAKATTATESGVDLEFERAELERAESVFNMISDRVEKLRTEQRAPTRVSLLDGARAAGAPIRSNPYREMALIGLAMFLAPFGLVILWERIVGRVSGTQQLEQASRLAVIGEISQLPARGKTFGGSPGQVGEGIALFEESIDSLRTYLVLSESLKDMKTLAVTSSINSEGKTSVAVQLAVSIARASGQPTLLIDGDMRSPDVHNKLDIPLGPGLAEVLAGE